MARNRVQRRSVFVIVLATLLPLLLVSAVVMAMSYDATRRSAREQQVGLGKLVARDFSQEISTATRQLEVFGETLLSNTTLFDITNERLFPLILSNPIWNEVGFYTMDGQLQANAFRTAPSQLPTTLSEQDLQRVIQQRIAYIDPAPLAGTEPFLHILVVLGDSAGQGILHGQIAMSQFWELNKTLDQSSASRIFITDAQGRLISSGTPAFVRANARLDKNALYGNETVAEYRSIDQQEVLGVATTIAETKWNLFVERPLAEIYDNLNNLIRNMVLAVLGATLLAVLIGWVAGRRLSQPIEQLHTSVEAFGRDPTTFVPIDVSSGDELSELGAAFNAMTRRLRESQEELSASNMRLEQVVAERTAELEQGMRELKESSTVQQQLIETIQNLSIPVVPIDRDIIIMNLVGHMAGDRAPDIIQRLLEAIQTHKARIALIDVTGISLIDTHVAHAIIDAVNAAGLLGTDVIMVGIRPEIAQTLVSLDVDFACKTAANLEYGFALARSLVQRRY